MYFAKEMLEVKKILEELEYEVTVPNDTQECLENPELSER